MGTRPRLKVSSDRLVKPGIEPATPGLQAGVAGTIPGFTSLSDETLSRGPVISYHTINLIPSYFGTQHV